MQAREEWGTTATDAVDVLTILAAREHRMAQRMMGLQLTLMREREAGAGENSEYSGVRYPLRVAIVLSSSLEYCRLDAGGEKARWRKRREGRGVHRSKRVNDLMADGRRGTAMK